MDAQTNSKQERTGQTRLPSGPCPRFQEHPVTRTGTAQSQGPCNPPSTPAGDLHAKLGGLARTWAGNRDSTHPSTCPTGCTEPESLGGLLAQAAGRQDEEMKGKARKKLPRSSQGTVTTVALELVQLKGVNGEGKEDTYCHCHLLIPALETAWLVLMASSN